LKNRKNRPALGALLPVPRYKGVGRKFSRGGQRKKRPKIIKKYRKHSKKYRKI